MASLAYDMGTSIPAAASTASNAPVNCRSRTRNRNLAARSPDPSAGSGLAARSARRPGARSRPGHGHGGYRPHHEEHVQPTQGDRAVDVEEVARQHGQGLARRNCRHVDREWRDAGSIRSRLNARRTVDAPIRWSRLNGSLWIRQGRRRSRCPAPRPRRRAPPRSTRLLAGGGSGERAPEAPAPSRVSPGPGKACRICRASHPDEGLPGVGQLRCGEADGR